MANVITYGVTLDASGAISGFKQLDAAIDSSAKKTTDYSKIAKTAGVAIVGGLVYAAHKIVSESRAAQAAQAQLGAVLKSTASAAGLTAVELNAAAAAFQSTTTYADDAVTAMQSVLLTFTGIKGDTFKRATAAILDVSTALGQDLKSSAIQVGKALNDPVAGLTALRKVGVSFTESQKSVIESLVATNRVAEAQAIILKELEVEFGGSAAAAKNTLGGALTSLSNAFGDLFEVTQEGSSGMINAINAITAALPALRKGVDEIISVFGIMAVETEIALSRSDRRIAKSNLAIYSALSAASQGVVGSLKAIKEAANIARLDAEIGALEAYKSQLELAFSANMNGATAADTHAKALKRLADAARTAGQGMKSFAERNPFDPERDPARGRTSERLAPRSFGVNIKPIVPGALAGVGKAALDEEARIRAEIMNEANENIARNFTENVQGAISGFFLDFLTTGRLSVKDLFAGFGRLAASVLAEIAAKSLVSSAAGNAAGGLFSGIGAFLKGPIGIALAVAGAGIALARGRSRTPAVARPTFSPTLGANDEMAATANRRDTDIRQSVGGVLTQSSAARIVGNLESIRIGIYQLVSLAQAGALGGNQVTVNASGNTSSGIASDAASSINRLLGGQMQHLRLASGVAVLT